jgi:hypothetical protein
MGFTAAARVELGPYHRRDQERADAKTGDPQFLVATGVRFILFKRKDAKTRRRKGISGKLRLCGSAPSRLCVELPDHSVGRGVMAHTAFPHALAVLGSFATRMTSRAVTRSSCVSG